MDGRFSIAVRELVRSAREYAYFYGDDYVGTEHLLLAICEDPEASVAKALRRLGIHHADILGQLERVPMGTESCRRRRENPPLTPAARRVLSGADGRKGLDLDRRIGRAALALALVEEPHGAARAILEELGAGRDRLQPVLQPGLSFNPHRQQELAFSAALHRAFARAAHYLQRFNHDQLDTVHMLLGLIDADGEATKMLRAVDISPATVFWDTQRRMQLGRWDAMPMMPLPWSPRLRSAMEIAATIAHEMRSTALQTSHVLVALAHPGGGTTADVLAELGTTAAELRSHAQTLCLEGWDIGEVFVLRQVVPLVPTSQDRCASIQGRKDSRKDDERLSGPVQRVLELAESIAIGFGHGCIGAEHVLIALAHGPPSIAREALASFGIDAAAVIRHMARPDSLSPRQTRSFRLPTQLLTHKLITRAGGLARNAGAAYIDTGHLLLALLESGGVVCNMLTARHVSRAAVLSRVCEMSADDTMSEPVHNNRMPPWRGEAVQKVLSAICQIRGGAAAGDGRHAANPCLRCDQDNPLAARYCRHCGQAIPRNNATHGVRARFDKLMRDGIDARVQGPAWTRVSRNCFQAARRLLPRNSAPLLEIARTYAAQRNTRLALRWYKRARKVDERCFEAWEEGARCLGRYADLRRARWLKGALAIRPGAERVRREFRQSLSKLRWWERPLV